MNTTNTDDETQSLSTPAITPAEALEILASAVNYCQQSGLTIRAGNVGGSATVVIDGVTLTDNPVQFRLVTNPSIRDRAKTVLARTVRSRL